MDKKPDGAQMQAEIEKLIKEAEEKMARKLQLINEQKAAAFEAMGSETAPAPAKANTSMDSPKGSQTVSANVLTENKVVEVPMDNHSDHEMSSIREEENNSSEDDDMKDEQDVHEYDMSEA